MLAYSGVAQAGYMLAGVVVAHAARRAGDRLLPRRLPGDEPRRVRGDRRARARDRRSATTSRAFAGLGRTRPLLAWPLTIAMLALAGIPATAGFIGKFYLIDAPSTATTPGSAIVIVIGSMISLGYYLRVVAAMWMRDGAGAGRGRRRAGAGRPARDRRRLAGGRRARRGRARRAPRSPRSCSSPGSAAAATIVLGIVPAAAVRPRRRTPAAR